MIVGEWKPIDELVSALAGYERILIAGCATCVAECAAGGEREVETLAPLLRMALAQRGRNVEIHTQTIERQCEWEFVEELNVDGIDAILSLACGIGVQALAERFETLPVLPGVNTVAMAMREEPGVWVARCAACGDCMLGQTFGYCPVARCAKSLMNGPCGGTRRSGKCELNDETDCVWQLIVKRAEERGALNSLREIRPTKNWSRSRHGGPKKIDREDLK